MRNTVALCLLAVSTACADRTPPAILDIVLARNDNEAVPLAGTLSITLDEPARLTLHFDDGDDQWTARPNSEWSTTHDVPVLGLRAESGTRSPLS